MCRIGKTYIPEKHEKFWMERDKSNILRCIRVFTMKIDYFNFLYNGNI